MNKINKILKLNKKSIFGLLFAFVLFFNIQRVDATTYITVGGANASENLNYYDYIAYGVFTGDEYAMDLSTILVGNFSKSSYSVGESALFSISSLYPSAYSYGTPNLITISNDIDDSSSSRNGSLGLFTTNPLSRSGDYKLIFQIAYYDVDTIFVGIKAYYNVTLSPVVTPTPTPTPTPIPTPTPVLPPIVNIRFE